MEGVRDGRKLLEIASRVTRTKPIVLFKVGRTDLGAAATLSHTGTLAGSTLCTMEPSNRVELFAQVHWKSWWTAPSSSPCFPGRPEPGVRSHGSGWTGHYPDRPDSRWTTPDGSGRGDILRVDNPVAEQRSHARLPGALARRPDGTKFPVRDAPRIAWQMERRHESHSRDHEIAASDDIVSVGGYEYFPPSSVRLGLLEKSPKTAHDLECPHGVQFYDVAIHGERHPRNAWSYELPRPTMEQCATGSASGRRPIVDPARAGGRSGPSWPVHRGHRLSDLFGIRRRDAGSTGVQSLSVSNARRPERSFASSHPLNAGLRFSAKAARIFIRSLFAPCSCSAAASRRMSGPGSGAHLAHHARRCCTREAGGSVSKCSAIFDGFRHQVLGLHEAVQETDVVKAFGGEAKAKRHFHRDRIGHVGDMAMVVAAQQPAFRFRHLEHGALHGHTEVGALHQHEAAAHGEAVDGGDDGFFQSAGHERVLDVRAPSAGGAIFSDSRMSSPAQKPRPLPVRMPTSSPSS